MYCGKHSQLNWGFLLTLEWIINKYKIMMYRFSLALTILLFASNAFSQLTYKVTQLDPIPIGQTFDPQAEIQDFFPQLLYTEAPNPSNTKLAEVKAKVSERYPRTGENRLATRSLVEPPVLLVDFEGNQRQSSTPPDNTIGISNGGQYVSAINSDLRFRTEDNGFIRNFSLAQFTGSVAPVGGKFDPRVIYDPEADRFAAVWLAGFNSEESSIIVAFSSASDIVEEWSVYRIEGSPEPGLWTDYPMIALTDNELVLTVNLLIDGESWQEGFAKSLIYQIDKETGYNGEALDVKLWSEIAYAGQPIRNLHPVKSGDATLENDLYFLSNRNFDIQNDSIFVLHLSGDSSDPDVELSIDVMKATTPYGVPPNALQSIGTLQTNDARILDAFRINDFIHFVGNTIDTVTGGVSIYHGHLTGLAGNMTLDSRILAHPTRDMGYPGLAWTGSDEFDSEAIIVAEHTSMTEFAGFSALYMDNTNEVSDWITIKEGGAHVDMLQNTDPDRWGDYIGCQPRYDQPGVVWTSAMYALPNSRTHTWIGILSRPIESTTDNLISQVSEMKVAPNPAIDRFTVKMDIASKDNLVVRIYDIQGELVQELYRGLPKKLGTLEFSFDLTPLTAGTYLVTAELGGRSISTERIIVK